MYSFKKIATIVFFLCTSILTRAQEGEKVKMADMMRSDGRIYVVVAVMLTILAGLILYLIRLERKINKLEKKSD